MDNLPASYSIDRGYTFHEHLDAFGLINMNGRVYDPLVARFLSPDPFIQNPEYSQSYNRYSYVFNTPLRFVDPSGYFAEGDSTGGGNRSIPNLFLKTPPRIPEIYETNTDVAQGEIMVLKYEGEEDHSRNRTRAGETMAQTLLLSARTSQFPPATVFLLGGGSFLASYYFLMDPATARLHRVVTKKIICYLCSMSVISNFVSSIFRKSNSSVFRKSNSSPRYRTIASCGIEENNLLFHEPKV
jgi:RHS repeat-associated protein